MREAVDTILSLLTIPSILNKCLFVSPDRPNQYAFEEVEGIQTGNREPQQNYRLGVVSNK